MLIQKSFPIVYKSAPAVSYLNLQICFVLQIEILSKMERKSVKSIVSKYFGITLFKKNTADYKYKMFKMLHLITSIIYDTSIPEVNYIVFSSFFILFRSILM